MGSIKKEKTVIARRIKELRHGKNETQQDLADILHISKQAVSKIEQDKTALTLDNAIRIAEHYDVSIEWITGRIEAKDDPTTLLDLISKYIRYTSRNPFPFEKNRCKDDDPFISLEVNAALHEYLIGIVKADNMLKYDDLDNGQDIYKGYVESIKRTFLENMKLLDWKPLIPLVEASSIKNPHKIENSIKG